MDVTADPGFARRVAGHAGVRLAVIGAGLAAREGGIASIRLEDFFEARAGGSGGAAAAKFHARGR